MNKKFIKQVGLSFFTALFLVITRRLHLIATTNYYNRYYFFISLAVTVTLIIRFGVMCYRDDDFPYFAYAKEMIAGALAGLIIASMFFSYSSKFTFERWKNKPLLRPFMVAELCDIQNGEKWTQDKYKSYNLNSYTREEVRELLSINPEMDSSDKFSFKFEDYDAETSEIKFEADIYYAYHGLDLRDYWLVLMYVKSPNSEKWRLSRAEVFAEGETVYGLYG